MSPRRLAKTDANYNYTITNIGDQGGGKTQSSIRDALAFQKFPAVVLVHDIQGRVPMALHDGTPTNLVRYRSIGQTFDGIKKHPFGRLHAIECVDGMDVIRAAYMLSQSSKKHHGDKAWTPVHVVIDEITMCSDAENSRKLGHTLRTRLANRRHELISYSFSSQSASMVHHQLLEWSTTICMFRILSKTAIARLDGVGVPPEILKKLGTLPQFKKIVWKK